MKDLFLLNRDVTYLNFGSFGACPKEIFDDYIKWQYLLESDPVQFITVDGIDHLKKSAISLAKYINCNYQDLVFVSNPTYAVNLLAKNISLSLNDEVLSTNLEYGALDRTWNYYCKKQGAKYVAQPISLPIASKEQFIEEFWKGFSENTKVVFISQITSTTGLILPVKEICEEAKKRGLITIVDGAHVPGHINLDLSKLKADFYTGACHKWMMTPKGCSFLYAKPEFQHMLEPLIISWGYESDNPSSSKFFDYHQFNGTRDFSAFLTVPKAVEFMNKHDWKSISSRCKSSLLNQAPKLFDLLNVEPLAPLTNEFFGQLCSVEINTNFPEKLKQLLFEKHKIEIPIMLQGHKKYIRISYQAFNEIRDTEYLIYSLKDIASTTRLLTI
ncbi:MAG: aminotransferase class V-fold PLP-dependent enzyme [Flavobacteriales bacterium]|jgi:isopenicillin-N epimerase|nr:aminotransferase class V-fold PLP-dependent enzyme [Flavobacteriales bacterium]